MVRALGFHLTGCGRYVWLLVSPEAVLEAYVTLAEGFFNCAEWRGAALERQKLWRESRIVHGASQGFAFGFVFVECAWT